MKSKITPRIAECVGLWLAEGDNKTKSEITFTNNCLPLIEFFADTIEDCFKNNIIYPRIYIYSEKNEKFRFQTNWKIKYYIDKRASKPYFIFRVASVKLFSEWKNLVEKIKNNEKLYRNILRGFFAGEGNLKEGIHSNKVIRIAQGKPNNFIEKILKYHGIKYRFKNPERSYVISGKWNWDKFAENSLADLHPIKKEKFWKIYNSYKEIHYPHNLLKNNILKLLNKPYTSKELSKRFNRSQSRIQDILIALKKSGQLEVFKIKSKSYWIKTDSNKIIISKIKNYYLKSLNMHEKNTTVLSKEIGVCWKSANNRLKELQKLNLVIRDSKRFWQPVNTNKEVVVL